MNNLDITILSLYTSVDTGVSTYTKNVIKEILRLKDKRDNINIMEISGKEIKILGTSFGGLAIPFVRALFTNPKSEIIHSFVPFLITPKTNILTLHDITPLTKPEDVKHGTLRKAFFKFLSLRMTAVKKIIATSNYTANLASNVLNIDRNKFKVVYAGVNHNDFYPSDIRPPEMSDDKHNILFVGDLRKRKNVHLIIEAIAILGDEYRFIRVGPQRDNAYARICEKLVRKYKIDYVNAGYVKNLRDYYTFADAFVFPSSEEGFGMPPMEAAACGTTSVVSNIPVFKEIYKDKVYYSSQNPEELALMIDYAVHHPKPKNELIGYAKKFTWENTARKIIEVYEEMYDNIS